MAVMAAIGVLLSILLPVLAKSANVGKRAVCVNNLKNLHAAYLLYLGDHDGKFFQWQDAYPGGGRLFYFGLDAGGGAEGDRPLDRSFAKLAPYIGGGGSVEICPSMPYRAPNFKQKYGIASYGYGINIYLLTNSPQCKRVGVTTLSGIEKPAETIIWADAAQINTFQAPASPGHPMLEEWYWLDTAAPQKYHFRHNGRVNVILGDGSVKSMAPDRLEKPSDLGVGALERGTEDYWLRTRK